MAANTYVALDTQTLVSASSIVTFSAIPQIYSDLVLVVNCKAATNASAIIRFNSDSGSNYSYVVADGNGALQGNRQANVSGIQILSWSTGMGSTTNNSQAVINIMGYSNTSIYKTAITKCGVVNASNAQAVSAFLGTWRNTAAITSVSIEGNTFAVGSSFSLYGVAAIGVTPAPKATGGSISSDANYYYHVFGSTGTFTPLSSLTADVLVVAGGGQGGGGNGGGGGAGGVRAFASQALSATGYTVTVGAGGSGGGTNAAGGSGNNSQFGALTVATGGGGGGGYSSGAALSGGSGGGGGTAGNTTAGGASPSGQGNAGGNGHPTDNMAGGGGGSGAAGGTGTVTVTGTGGNGTSAYSSWGLATGVGQNVGGVYYIAGGGSAGGDAAAGDAIIGAAGYGGGGLGGSEAGGNNALPGVANTGGGGGGEGGGGAGANGGSGVVVVRYLKV